jgi:hydroxyacylglutathione hydrolase
MLKKILTVLGVVVVIVVAGFGWLSFQMRELKPIATAQISDSIFVAKGSMCNIYFMRNNGAFIAFDAGDNVQKIAAGCASLGIATDSVKAIFLTHSDGDHVGGLTLFPEATVYLSRDEVPLITGKIPRHFLFFSQYNKLAATAYKALADSDSVMVAGMTVHAIATPGHTAGSMCFRVGDALFTGDLCLLKQGAIEPMLEIFTENMAMDSVSIRRIARQTDIRTVYTAHTGYTNNFQQAFAHWQ